MPAAYKTPGVYIVEKDAFPNSVVEVATAVPAFIGYTEKAVDLRNNSLLNKPTRISSLSEFETYFGVGPKPKFSFAETTDAQDVEFVIAPPGGTKKSYKLTQTEGKYLLYYSMKLFFGNGGGPCYIVSVATGYPNDDLDAEKLKEGIDLLEAFPEPTLIVVPDAVLLKSDNCYDVQNHALLHCGFKMQNRFAILDVFDGDKKVAPGVDPIAAFRTGVNSPFVNYGAAYYPWLHTTVLQDRDVDYTFIAEDAGLADALRPEMTLTAKSDKDNARVDAWNKGVEAILSAATPAAADATADAEVVKRNREQTHQSLLRMSPGFKDMMSAVAKKLNRMPPSGAMAGIYKMVDDTRGVWKAPANVGVLGATAPIVEITNADQEDLNVTPQGKSINAIRSFIGEGVMVWGARTLDGNSLDWRYVNVRRTMIMLEESCKLAAKAYVFEPNVAGTWLSIRTMIENFLTSVWKRGGLAGATTADAFSVHVGLGDTMTAEDILEGRLNVTVLVAVSRPAEFIEITFQQQMQKS